MTRPGNEYDTPTTSRHKVPVQHTPEVSGDRFRSRITKTPRSPDSLAPLSSRSTSRLSSQNQRRGRSLVTPQPGFDSQPLIGSSRLSELSSIDTGKTDGGESDNKLGDSFISSNSDDNSIYDDPVSPSIIAAQAPFSSAVATPPVAEADYEPFSHISRALTEAGPSRPTLVTSGIQNVSLPSPSLSPTFAAAKLHDAQFGNYDDERRPCSTQEEDSEKAIITGDALRYSPQSRDVSIVDAQSMISTFDGMPDEMKSHMMYRLLQRCSRKTLHQLIKFVSPNLKQDFMEVLPAELKLHVLSFLDHKDLCRAAQVSKNWRQIIDTHEAGWKELLERDNFVLPDGELEKAIAQGWGWQDPHGLDGFERDLSTCSTMDSEEPTSNIAKSEPPHASTRASAKRKRTAASIGREHSKRHRELPEGSRSSSQKSSTSLQARKSEGPKGASVAAVMAVPNPNLGMTTLQNDMHLYKSLYRRHYILQRNWMNDKIQPYHMAFPAHPRHVITCLQFDDDKIITGSDDTFIHVYDTKTGALRKRLEGHEGGVWALQYEGNVLVSGSTDRSVRVWDIEKGICTQVFHGHTSTVRCLQIVMPAATGKMVNGKPQVLPEKPLIITGSRDSHLRVWKLPEPGSKRYGHNGSAATDADCPYFMRVLVGHTHSVRAIAAHSDVLVSGSYDNSVRVWKISTGDIIHVLRGHQQKVYSVVLDVKRNRCISGSMDNTVKIWSLETGDCVYTLEGHSSLVGLLDLKDDRLVSAAADSTLRIWDPATGQCKSTLTAHTGAITCFQHDSTKVISGSDRTLKMWNVKTGECLQDILTDLTGVWQVRFDERRCVAAVQRDGNTFLEVLDFGASRDGRPASERGYRHLLPASAVDRVVVDDNDVVDN